MPLSQKSNRLPKARSTDWLELATACERARKIVREDHAMLHKIVLGRKGLNDYWVNVPLMDLEVLYTNSMKISELLRHALKAR